MTPPLNLSDLPGPIRSAEDFPRALSYERLKNRNVVNDLPFERTRLAVGEVYLYGGEYIEINQILCADEVPLGTDVIGMIAVRFLDRRERVSFVLSETWTDFLEGPIEFAEKRLREMN